MIKVGCCGFPTSMEKYFETFNIVELNNTFYQYPRKETVEGWKQKAPKNFEFTVKAHQDITHKEKLKVGATSLQAFETMKQICRTLDAKILLFQTSSSFSSNNLKDVERFFRTLNRENLVFVWEPRGPSWETPEINEKLRAVLSELNVSHVTDPFRVLSAYTGEISYFRLHGLGKQMYYYQYTDAELQRLKQIVSHYEKKSKSVYIFFNNLTMFEDALRFNEYLADGTFPPITKTAGLASIREVVEKIRYPVAKSMLIKKLGWRIIEVRKGEQIRLETFLNDLPSRTYGDVEELINTIKAVKKLCD